MAWIARHRDDPGIGDTLLETAFGFARHSARTLGAAAFAVDPGDDAVAEYWRRLGFRDSRPRWEGAPTRLWLPLHSRD